MGKIVAKTEIKKEPGYLYFLNKNGDVSRVQMARAGQKTSKKKEVVAKACVTKEEGYLYYIDKAGNVAAAKMVRGGRKKKAAKKTK